MSFDVNNDGVQTTLTPYDDWKNLKLKGGSIGAGNDAVQPMVTVVDEITPEQAALVLPRDTTPPITTGVITPTPNAAGWNRTDVVVTLSATDDISGVARTEYTLDGVGPAAGTGPIPLTAEGIHTLEFHSIDRSQNVEATRKLVIRIDKTPPEEVITYDPVNHRVVVTGRDALSGVNPGAVSPISLTPSTWTEFGSDTAQIRTYLVVDHAGNSATLTMKVKCEPDEYELSVMEIRYNGGLTRHEQTKPHKPQRNTIEFERLIARGLDHPLLDVTQEVSFGEGTTRSTVESTWDVLHDEPEIEHWTGDFNCGQPRDDRGKSSDQQEEENDPEQRGLILLRVVTDKGHLKLEE